MKDYIKLLIRNVRGTLDSVLDYFDDKGNRGGKLADAFGVMIVVVIFSVFIGYFLGFMGVWG